MKLWIVLHEVDREPGSIIGVFSDEIVARDVAARLDAADKWDLYAVRCVEMDKEYEKQEIR